MFNYMTRQMVAQQSMTYAGQELEPGDSFYATPDDERYFTRNGRARTAGAPQEPRRFVPAVAPIGETSTVVAVLVPDGAKSAPSASAAVEAAADPVTAAAPAHTVAAESAQVSDDKTAAKATDDTATAAAANRPAPATRARTRLLTSAGEAPN